MRRRRWVAWGISAVIATTIVVAFFLFFQRASSDAVTRFSLGLARQVVAQVQQLNLEARSRGERNPLLWAAQKLSAGTEPRLLKIIPARVPSSVELNSEDEVYGLDSKTAVFDYTRVLDRTSGEGVRVYVMAGEVGLGGILNHRIQDLVLFFVWVSVFLSVGWFSEMGRTTKKLKYVQSELRRDTGQDSEFNTWLSRVQSEIDALERFKLVMNRINDYSGWAEKAAQSFLDQGYDDPREILFQAQRLHEYLSKLHQVTDRGQSLLSQYHKKIKASAEWTPRTGTQG